MNELKNHTVSKFTTLQIGGVAEKICLPGNKDELINLTENIHSKKQPWSLIGGGSNILVSSEDIPGVVICTTNLNEIKVLDGNRIEAGSGVRLPRLSAYAAKNCLSGFEFCEGIPGTVGGAVVMNAGAHGSWTSRILESIEILDIEKGNIFTLKNEDIEFGYRISSINPTKQIVISAIFALTKDLESKIRERMRHNNISRRSSQPVKIPNAGCTFSNPLEHNISAGKLLDELGAKNWSIGDAQVSSMHANFIINLGHATSHDVCKLISKMQKEAFEKKSIILKPEVKPLGLFEKEESKIWSEAGFNESNCFISIK